ncbi:hypothetical protein [Pseudoxanthomonas sp. PXM05]|uniref:hypothetical protein n=1 Tax=Pseudoxanthomonas sp. PXM05 TaxID=2854775 RepID=UPI001C470B37|nr:hypothetical protein [Pseudoxanthomonas sp. PXM05]MBV7475354.1 hypothetical protein [Pseudoxanthomonas sp. PXM05]
MNITHEQIPDEVVKAALNQLFPEHYERHLHPDWSPAIREALAAALPVLLVQEGYRIDWYDTTFRGKQTVSETKCSDEFGRSTPLYSIRTPESPNE